MDGGGRVRREDEYFVLCTAYTFRNGECTQESWRGTFGKGLDGIAMADGAEMVNEVQIGSSDASLWRRDGTRWG